MVNLVNVLLTKAALETIGFFRHLSAFVSTIPQNPSALTLPPLTKKKTALHELASG